MSPRKKNPSTPRGQSGPKPRLLSTGVSFNDYQEIKVYFENGCCSVKDAKGRPIKALQPQEILHKFPQFASYDYSSFNSVVQRLRKQFEKIATDRRAYGRVNTYHSGGLTQRNTGGLPYITEGEEDDSYGSYHCADDDVDDAFADHISTLSLDDTVGGGGYNDEDGEDGDDCSYYSTVSSVGAFGSVAGAGRSNRRKMMQSKMIHGSDKAMWDYILDEWKYPERRLSLQIRLPSGTFVHQHLEHRVSTNQDEYVLALPYSANFRSVEAAFFSYLGKDSDTFVGISNRLKGHPKIIARKISMAKLLRRNPTKELWVEQRIKLPYPVKHLPATRNDGCDDFHGVRFVQYDNSEVHLHVELVKDVKDGYKHDRVSIGIQKARRAIKPPGTMQLNIPATLGNSVGCTTTEMETDEDNACEDKNASNARHYAESVLKRADGVSTAHVGGSSVDAARLLCNEYDGAANRGTRSVKSLKRTASVQDAIQGYGLEDDDGESM